MKRKEYNPQDLAWTIHEVLETNRYLEVNPPSKFMISTAFKCTTKLGVTCESCGSPLSWTPPDKSLIVAEELDCPVCEYTMWQSSMIISTT